VDCTRQLYLDHHRWLVGWLRRRTGCPERAADVAQDTFCRLLTGSPETEPRRPRALLTRIATRLMIDRGRRERLERAYLETCSTMAAEHPGAPSPECLAELIDALEMITRALEDLPDKPRRAFLMNRLDGMRHREIAAELGVSKSSVKQYIARAMVHCYYVAGEHGS